ncbi:hypothetical protein ACO2RV_23775 [Ancylobacter sp. VNQ12]|uniref:hypothetical protein n=1 Tax=Ancylobacter sp. VNQ12 TaxID=3400920 RepID=UPI003C04EBE5
MSDQPEPIAPTEPDRLEVRARDFDRAAEAGILNGDQARALWDFLAAQAPKHAPTPEVPRFSFGHTLYYFGGLIAIAAMSLFMTLTWDALGPWGICTLALLYAAACWAMAEMLHARGLAIPAGLLAALAVCLVPLITWSAQNALGLWPEVSGAISGERLSQYHQWIDARWLTLEVATLIMGALALWRLRLPFLVMPVAVTLWYMSMDLSRWPAGEMGDVDFDHARRVSIVFGIAMCLMAGALDLYRRRYGTRDFATWLYLFGAFAAWSGITLSHSDSEMAKLVYGLFNAGLVLFGAVIGRRIFTVLGTIGVALYLGYLAFELFQDSLLFPLALSLIGLGIVGLGIWWQKHEASIVRRLSSVLPGIAPR